MNDAYKVMSIVGTRPELIRLSCLFSKFDKTFNHILVHTGQNSDYELNQIFFQDLSIRQPDEYLNIENTSLGQVIGEVFKKSEEVILKHKPDAIVILGDTNSALASIMARRMNLPVYHLEAGNRSFDQNVPEEINRKIVDHTATFNLAYSSHAMNNLLNEGLDPKFLSLTGSPMKEIVLKYSKKVESSEILAKLNLTPKKYFVASFHRQENVDNDFRLSTILQTLDEIYVEWKIPIIVSTHPRTRKKLINQSQKLSGEIIFHDPFSYSDYCKLQKESLCVFSDSGTISEESYLYGFSAVSIRNSIERFEALETGSIINSGLNPNNIIQSINFILNNSTTRSRIEFYDIENFSDRVISFIFSTIDNFNFMTGIRP